MNGWVRLRDQDYQEISGPGSSSMVCYQDSCGYWQSMKFLWQQSKESESHQASCQWGYTSGQVSYNYPYHQWLKSSRWQCAGPWWCAKTPLMKRSEVRASLWDQDSNGQLTHQWHKLKECWITPNPNPNPCVGRQGLGSTHFQQGGKANLRLRWDMIQAEVRHLEEVGAGLRAANLDHNEPGQSGTCQSWRSLGLRPGGWSPIDSLSCSIQCMTVFHHQQTSTDGDWGAWTKWDLPKLKITWPETWKLEPFRISFLLRPVYDTLPSPTNCHRWGLRDPHRYVEGEEQWRTYWRDARQLSAREDTDGTMTRFSVHWLTLGVGETEKASDQHQTSIRPTGYSQLRSGAGVPSSVCGRSSRPWE